MLTSSWHNLTPSGHIASASSLRLLFCCFTSCILLCPAGTASVNKADAAQFGGRNGYRGQMPGGGAWMDAPGRMWMGRKMLGE
jgi:hypothetical protein